MKLTTGFLLIGAASALPRSPKAHHEPISPRSPLAQEPEGAPERCGVNDMAIWTTDNWNEKEVSDWFDNWEKENIKGDARVSETFSEYWGMGHSFRCSVELECGVPQCSVLKRPSQGKDYEHAAMVLASMGNFNRFCVKLYHALNGANIDFTTINEDIQQTFYPSVNPANFVAIDGLNGGSAAFGAIAAFLGPLATSVKEAFTAVARDYTRQMMATDLSLKRLAEMGRTAQDHFTKSNKRLEKMHNDFLYWGVYEYTKLGQLFDGGAWVDDENIPVVNDEVLQSDMQKYFSDMVFAMIINKAWIEQGAYIFSVEMDQQACEEYKPKYYDSYLGDVPKLCYQGRAYWLNIYEGKSATTKAPGAKPPPGTDKLEEIIGSPVLDAMRSSIDFFNEYGYNADSSALVDKMAEGDIQANIDSRARFAGTFTIPVCEAETSDEIDEVAPKSDHDNWKYIIWGTSTSKRPNHGLQPCLCASAKDRNGEIMKDLDTKAAGPDSFASLLNTKNHQVCNYNKGAFG